MITLMDYGPFWITPDMKVVDCVSHYRGILANYSRWGFTKNAMLNKLSKKVTQFDGRLNLVYAVINRGFIRGDLTEHDNELRLEGLDYKTMFGVARDIGRHYPLEGVIIETWKDMKKINSVEVNNEAEFSDKAVKMFLKTGKIPDRFTTYR